MPTTRPQSRALAPHGGQTPHFDGQDNTNGEDASSASPAVPSKTVARPNQAIASQFIRQARALGWGRPLDFDCDCWGRGLHLEIIHSHCNDSAFSGAAWVS